MCRRPAASGARKGPRTCASIATACQPMSGRGCMAGAPADTIRSAASCWRSSVPPTVACMGPAARVVRVTTRVTWSVETRIDRHRAQVGQPGQACEQAMGRLAHVQRGLQPCGVGRAGYGIAARAIDLADVQVPAEIGGRGEFARAIQCDGNGGAGQCRTDVQPRNPQLAQDDRHGQARTAGRRPGRHAYRLDVRRLEPVDHDAPVQQLQRRPVECQVLDRGVGSLRVAQFDPRDAQRVREPPGNAGEADRVSGHSWRQPFERSLSWRGVDGRPAAAQALPPAPSAIQPIHFAARRIRRPAQCRCTVRRSRHWADGSMGLRRRDELGRSRCNTGPQRPLPRASCP